MNSTILSCVKHFISIIINQYFFKGTDYSLKENLHAEKKLCKKEEEKKQS